LISEQVKVVVKKYIIIGKAFNLNEIRSYKESEDIQEDFRKLKQSPGEEKREIISDVKN